LLIYFSEANRTGIRYKEPTEMDTRPSSIRPKLLTWLCTVSVIFGVFWLIMLLALLIYDVSGNIPGHLFPRLVLEYAAVGKGFMALQLLLTLLGIGSVILMWQMNKVGFYLYAIVKAIVYFMPALIIGAQHYTFPALVFTSLMIIMYGSIFTNKGNFEKKLKKE